MPEKQLPWTEQFRPANLGEVAGNDEAVSALRKWFEQWDSNAKRKAAILHGPAGIGKTSSVYALANERGYEIVEMNASDTRNKKSILQIAGSSAKEGSLINGANAKRILLIDEVDGITGREDRGGVKSLVDVIKEASVPIICTANEAYHSKLKALRKISKVITYKSVDVESIIKVLKKICRKIKVEIPQEDIKFIAKNANGDLRSAINDLQGMVLQLKSGKISEYELLRPFRDQTKDIQDALRDLFNSKSFIEGKKAIDGLDMKYDELLLWVFDNAYLHTSTDQLDNMYDTIAYADRFLGRIMRRQDWKLLSYFFDLVSGGVAVEADKKSLNKDYIFPRKIGLYARTMFSRAIRDSIATNIAEKIHVSKKSAIKESYFLVEQILNSSVGDAAQLAYWLELDNNQIKALLQDNSSIKKINKVIKAIEEDKVKKQTSMGELKHSSFDRPVENWDSVLDEWEKKKIEKEEIEKKKKEEEKKNKKKAPSKKQPKEDKEEEKKKQASLDQFL